MTIPTERAPATTARLRQGYESRLKQNAIDIIIRPSVGVLLGRHATRVATDPQRAYSIVEAALRLLGAKGNWNTWKLRWLQHAKGQTVSQWLTGR